MTKTKHQMINPLPVKVNVAFHAANGHTSFPLKSIHNRSLLVSVTPELLQKLAELTLANHGCSVNATRTRNGFSVIVRDDNPNSDVNKIAHGSLRYRDTYNCESSILRAVCHTIRTRGK